jgi:hypothetical protein
MVGQNSAYLRRRYVETKALPGIPVHEKAFYPESYNFDAPRLVHRVSVICPDGSLRQFSVTKSAIEDLGYTKTMTITDAAIIIAVGELFNELTAVSGTRPVRQVAESEIKGRMFSLRSMESVTTKPLESKIGHRFVKIRPEIKMARTEAHRPHRQVTLRKP